MQWSFPIARVAGSEIRIHLTFFILLAWFGLIYLQEGGPDAVIEGVGFILALFTCVVLHELGHALAARQYGIVTPRITLLPIGGVAELERMPEKPEREIIVALAGPAVNVVIAAILIIGFGAWPAMETLQNIEEPDFGFWTRLAMVNIMLVVFNMIPAFPMDGGRVLRAVLSTRYSRVKATDIAARLGQAVAFLFGALGLLSGNVLLIFIAIFVYVAAATESQAVTMQAVTRSHTAADGMITSYEALGPDATLGGAADLLLRTTQHEFPVLDNDGAMVGVLTRTALVAGMEREGRESAVGAHLELDIPIVYATDSLELALNALSRQRKPAVAVLDRRSGRLAGYITSENLGEMMLLASASSH